MWGWVKKKAKAVWNGVKKAARAVTFVWGTAAATWGFVSAVRGVFHLRHAPDGVSGTWFQRRCGST